MGRHSRLGRRAPRLALALAVGLGAHAAQAESFTLGYSVGFLTDPFQAIQVDLTMAGAKKAGLQTLPVANANGDAGKQITDFHNLIAQGAKGIIVVPTDSDAIAPDARRKAVAECQRILAPGGRFYLGTPVGREHLHFNSGRVFDPRTIIAAMPRLGLTSFNAVDDSGALIEPGDAAAFATAEYTCGLFEFTAP